MCQKAGFINPMAFQNIFSSKWLEQTKTLGFIPTFFLIGIHSMQGWTATRRHAVTRKWKRSTKRLGSSERT